MKRLPTLSLRWKLVLASILVELAMLVTLAWNGLRLIDDTLQKQAEIRLREISILLNSAIAPGMVTQDYAPIADVFSQSRRRDGILYFLLTDPQGKPLLTDGWDPQAAPPKADGEIDVRQQHERFDTRIPVTLGGQEYGHLYFGISTQFIDEARKHLTRQSLFIAAIAIALSMVLLSALTLWLTRPLERLRQASKAVGEGNFRATVDIRTSDEIGQLADAFNAMTEQLDRQLMALVESESRFRSLLTLSTDLYWEQDAQFRFVKRQTGRFTDYRRYSAEWLLGKCRWELDTTLSEEAWAAHRKTLEAHETFRNFEYGVRFPDGSLHYFRIHGEPVFDESGQFSGYRGTAVDISQRKRAEASLHLAASVFAEAQEGIVIADRHWHIVDLNPMACQLTGQTRDALLGHDLRAYFACPEETQLSEEIESALARHSHWRGEALALGSDGKTSPLMLTVSAVGGQGQEVDNLILIFSDITAIKEQQARLEALAHYDSLTGLPNRVLFADRLRLGLMQAARHDELLAVAYLDLDGFKPVNDQFGHDAGDRLLVEVGERLRTTLRGGDTVARLGGDEFALLMRAEDFGECEAALLRVLCTLSGEYNIKGQAVSISASIGVTLFPNDTNDPDLLLRHADQAMYIAKQAGRNRYHFFDAELDNQLRSRHLQLGQIEAALQADEFVLFYQPKVDLLSGQVTGAEALIRWQHPERGLLPPSEFLPLLENTDLAIPLGETVIAKVLEQMESWQRTGLQLPISLNVAARQLQAPDFADRLRKLLARHPDIPTACLQLEIVETAALDDIPYVNSVIAECLRLGVSFALDDFGTGYSSLTYFRRLPIQTLKIDRSFVRDMLNDQDDLAIVEGVIGLARAFRREVIAEGVESAEHGIQLLKLGCHLAQGYGIARPMPAAELADWVANYRPDPAWQLEPAA